MDLDQSDINRVRETFTQINTISDLTARFFYERLFALSPETEQLFTGNMQTQRGKFMATLRFIVEVLDEPESLQTTMHRLSQEHAQYRISDEDYRMVGEALLWSLERTLGPAYTPAVAETWSRLYALLAGLMKENADAERRNG
ncbi:MAG: hypothetical protein KF893_10155 [Caldilineaceae bacterium]|nr:hypothetical protein [Caldilineaceae bacterium]